MVPDLKLLLITKNEVKGSPSLRQKRVADSCESNNRKPLIRYEKLVNLSTVMQNNNASTEKSKGTRSIAQER